MSSSNQFTWKGQGVQIAPGAIAGSGYGAMPLGGLTINTSNKMNLPGITFKITPANGGTIITVTDEIRRENTISISGGYEREELYIIPEGVKDFDKELGKIITMHRMKQQHE